MILLDKIQGIALVNTMGGCGKDTIAHLLSKELLQYGQSSQSINLSKGIYEVAYNIFDVEKGTKPPRTLLQHIGESLRGNGYDNLWINKTLSYIEDIKAKKSIPIVTDVRKEIEFDEFKKRGYIMIMVKADKDIALDRINKRDGKMSEEDYIATTTSLLETALVNHEDQCHIVIENNGTLKQLENRVKSIAYLLLFERFSIINKFA